MLKMNTRRVNRALNEAVRLLDEQIADTQKTMQELNKQLEKQIKAKQELMVLVDVMNGDDE
ncbi:TreS [Staphylococcus phage A3R]|uniref:TreS n=15 Tax=Kayvirus TaxID=1857843 RepID=I6WJC0_9CAUD|nr:TreS [Staphylococcus phage Staph1N]YP_009780704.1 TreS [Staphylococcus phage Staph1N]YP_009780724.1 TreS [Staphylococcus phage A3R]YP_009780916.1 TreS [Staphylococcus phage A3R]AFN37838.1 TreS [Staphylococcus phage Staph1N]AFN38048.1 TreS [Staphylococcus phage A3R]AHL83197.1 TreS [Staphylococcus phage Staph1N]AHL83230.1 TreS [Staphylococcus phage A3R]